MYCPNKSSGHESSVLLHQLLHPQIRLHKNSKSSLFITSSKFPRAFTETSIKLNFNGISCMSHKFDKGLCFSSFCEFYFSSKQDRVTDDRYLESFDFIYISILFTSVFYKFKNVVIYYQSCTLQFTNVTLKSVQL